MEKVCFISLGCPKNQVDSEVMLGGLIEEGYIISDDPAASAIVIVNTCSFIEDAKKESIDTILEMAEYKKKGACRLLVVTGCLPQRYRDELAKSLPEVDLFVGVGDIPRLVELIDEHEGKQHISVGRPHFLYDHDTPRVLTGRHHAAYLKIAEGCFHPCSFCIIPKIRGAYRSRSMDSIVKEAKDLIGHGVRELNLIAQDSTGYGHDLKTDADLGTLLAHLVNLNGDKWIRILYAYPHNFPESVILAMRDHKDIVNYLDIPLQHISDRIIKSMRREGDAAEVRALIDKLREQVPGIALRTSVIVGYPGETDAEFKQLLEFIRGTRFEHLGAFTYSLEEGTAAAKLGDQIPQELAEERWHEVMDVQKEISSETNRSLLGRKLKVLIEGTDDTGNLLVSRHAGQAPDVDGVVYINEGTAGIGDFATVEVTEAHEYDLIGRVIV